MGGMRPRRAMLGVPSTAVRVQPVRSMLRAVVLRSSSHSSLAVSGAKPGHAAKVGAEVPAQAISERTTSRTAAVSRRVRPGPPSCSGRPPAPRRAGWRWSPPPRPADRIGQVQPHQVAGRRGQRLEQVIADDVGDGRADQGVEAGFVDADDACILVEGDREVALPAVALRAFRAAVAVLVVEHRAADEGRGRQGADWPGQPAPPASADP